MKILVVGGGGREHAIIRKLKESKQVDALYCAPGNGGISKDAECFPVKATDVEGMVALAKQLSVDLVFVAPDDPLVLGMVDAMQAAGFATFGPNQAAAIIEGSKAFSKELMKKYHIPTAKYEIFHDADAAIAYIKQENQFPTVIKADGLALGKGVIIAANLEEAEQAVKSMMEDKMFGESGSTVVVEEFLTGPEVFHLLILFVFFCGLLPEVFSFPASFFPQFLLSLLPLSSLFLILWEHDPIFSSFSLWRFPFLKKHPLGWKGKQCLAGGRLRCFFRARNRQYCQTRYPG